MGHQPVLSSAGNQIRELKLMVQRMANQGPTVHVNSRGRAHKIQERIRVNASTGAPQDNEDPVLDRGLPDRFIVHSSGRFKVGDYAQLIDSNLRLTKGIFGLRVRRDTGLYAPRGKSRAGVGTDGKIARLFYLGERQERNGSLTE